MIKFPFLYGDFPYSTSYGVNISQLIRFAGVFGRVAGLGAHDGVVAAGLLQQGCRYHGLPRTLSNFFRRFFAICFTLFCFQIKIEQEMLQYVTNAPEGPL